MVFLVDCLLDALLAWGELAVVIFVFPVVFGLIVVCYDLVFCLRCCFNVIWCSFWLCFC